MADMAAARQTDPTASRPIYLVISQTGTLPSRILKAVTGAEYNHVSISLNPELTKMYSFARRNPYNPFWAGFVLENPHTGTFKRFPKTKAVVLELPVSGDAYQEISRLLDGMLSEQTTYHYNYVGLFLAAARIQYRKGRRYYCSEFVKDILFRFHIGGCEQLPPIAQPIHFLAIPGAQRIYCGYLRDYSGQPD